MKAGGRGSEQRGSATLLVAASLLIAASLVAVGLTMVAYQITAHRVQGAADLVAVTAAQAKNVGLSEPCAAAARASAADDVSLVSCRVQGGELSFVVTVTVRGGSGRALFGVPLRAEASANAGVRTDGP